MCVSITGLKTKNIFSWFKFCFLRFQPSEVRKKQKVLFFETKKVKNYHHTLTVWESKNDMTNCKKSSSHIKAMRSFKSIATGKIYRYETNLIPSWDEVLVRFNNEAYEVLYKRN